MSNTFKTKKACKNKRLTGFHKSPKDFDSSDRDGNERKANAKTKVRERRKESRKGRRDLETIDHPKTNGRMHISGYIY